MESIEISGLRLGGKGLECDGNLAYCIYFTRFVKNSMSSICDLLHVKSPTSNNPCLLQYAHLTALSSLCRLLYERPFQAYFWQYEISGLQIDFSSTGIVSQQ